jgi:hypothetical protein
VISELDPTVAMGSALPWLASLTLATFFVGIKFRRTIAVRPASHLLFLGPLLMVLGLIIAGSIYCGGYLVFELANGRPMKDLWFLPFAPILFVVCILLGYRWILLPLCALTIVILRSGSVSIRQQEHIAA